MFKKNLQIAHVIKKNMGLQNSVNTAVEYDKDIVINALTTALRYFGEKTAKASHIGQFEEVLIIGEKGTIRLADELNETVLQNIPYSEPQLKCA